MISRILAGIALCDTILLMVKTIDTWKAANASTDTSVKRQEAEPIVGVIADSGGEIVTKRDIKGLEVKANMSIALNIAVRLHECIGLDSS